MPEHIGGHSLTLYDSNKTIAAETGLFIYSDRDYCTCLSIVKQLPVLPPETYLEEVRPGLRFAELIVPRVLELTYTAHDLEGFARDLSYNGPPFPWDEYRRHCLRCELDAMFMHMYQLNRSDVEWIPDAPAPSYSFPRLK